MSYFDPADGRRRSDPLKSIDLAPAKAPDWQLNRVVATQDLTFTDRNQGVNASQYKSLRFAIVPMDLDPTRDDAAVPGGGENPNVEARIWSEQAGAFIPFPTPITKTGAGAGTAYMLDVPNADGAIIGVFVTNAFAGSEFVAISSQGYENEEP